MQQIDIFIAQNDDNGKLTNQVAQIEFFDQGESIAKLEPKVNETERVITSGDRIEMYGYQIKTGKRHEWAGNMIWNSYLTDADYALGFLNMLLLSKRWSVTSGYSSIYKKWEKGQEVKAKDIFDDEVQIKPRILNTRATLLQLNPKIKFEMPCILNLPGEDIDNPNQTKLPL